MGPDLGPNSSQIYQQTTLAGKELNKNKKSLDSLRTKNIFMRKAEDGPISMSNSYSLFLLIFFFVVSSPKFLPNLMTIFGHN